MHKPRDRTQGLGESVLPKDIAERNWPTPPGFEPGTSRSESWCANHLATRAPTWRVSVVLKSWIRGIGFNSRLRHYTELQIRIGYRYPVIFQLNLNILNAWAKVFSINTEFSILRVKKWLFFLKITTLMKEFL